MLPALRILLTAGLTRHSLGIFLVAEVHTMPFLVSNQGAAIAIIVAVAVVVITTVGIVVAVVIVVIIIVIVVVVIVTAGDEN
jgi:hypothetical protein